MKNKILRTAFIIVIVISLLFLTGCSSSDNEIVTQSEAKQESNNNEEEYVIDEITDYVNGYVWVYTYKSNKTYKTIPDSFEHLLLDKSGKIVHRAESSIHSDVHSNYFIADKKLYNIQSGEVDLGEYNDYGKIIGTDNGKRDVLKLSNTVKNFDGTFTDTVYIDLTNMKEIDKVDKFSSYGASKLYGDNIYLANYNGSSIEIIDKDELNDFKKDCYKCVENNGYFTILDQNNNQCFEPIKGNALDADDSTKSVAMTDGEKLYVVDINGNQTEIPNYSYFREDSVMFADGMLCIINWGSSTRNARIFRDTGEEVTIHD